MKRLLFILVTATVMSTALSVTVFAQDDNVTTHSFFDLYIAPGGFIGAFIILMSVIGIGLTIMNGMTIRRDNLVPEDLYHHIDMLFDERFTDGELIEWSILGERRSYLPDFSRFDEARKLIEQYVKVPCLHTINGFSYMTPLTLVALR